MLCFTKNKPPVAPACPPGTGQEGERGRWWLTDSRLQCFEVRRVASGCLVCCSLAAPGLFGSTQNNITDTSGLVGGSPTSTKVGFEVQRSCWLRLHCGVLVLVWCRVAVAVGALEWTHPAPGYCAWLGGWVVSGLTPVWSMDPSVWIFWMDYALIRMSRLSRAALP